MRQFAGHPAVLCYAVGNEIPASVVRYGRRRIERFLTDLRRMAREADPGALVTYVNFPTTEYLHLSEVDFISFNVYLELKERLAAYLARVQNIAGERPLLMAEIGLDSRRNGLPGQAESLEWQIATAFESGCVGAFVFAWTTSGTGEYSCAECAHSCACSRVACRKPDWNHSFGCGGASLLYAEKSIQRWKHRDHTPFDLWSIVHAGAGIVFGLWSVPFPLVAVFTIAWEYFEWKVPGLWRE